MPSASPRFLRFLTGPVEAGCALGAELLAGDAVAVVEWGSGCALWFACRTASDWNEGPPAMPRVGSARHSELSFVRASLEDRLSRFGLGATRCCEPSGDEQQRQVSVQRRRLSFSHKPGVPGSSSSINPDSARQTFELLFLPQLAFDAYTCTHTLRWTQVRV